MPDNPGGQFPVPPSAPEPTPPTPPQEVRLTDEVAPDLSAPPPTIEEAPAPRSEAEIPRIPAGPANVPPSKPFPILTLFLILVAIGASAATYFFYQQSQSLNAQLVQLQRTIEQQRVSPTPTPEVTLTLSPTTESTISATPTATAAATATPSPTIAQGPARSAFSDISNVISTAQKKYPNAQLLMITGTNVQSDSQIILKYWFRQTATDKKYLYILREPGKDLSLVDQQVYVTPDNNIPSLNQEAEADRLGIDLHRAYQIAANLCTGFDCGGSATAQFIKTNTTLWQITIKIPSRPFVVQIDSKTEKILFQSQ